MKRIVAVKPSSIMQQIQIADQILVAEEKRSNNEEEDPFIMHPVARATVEKKSKRLDRDGDFSDLGSSSGSNKRKRHASIGSTFYVDWAAEMEQFRLITCAMETKFNQLSKLKKVIQVKAPPRTKSAGRSKSAGRI